MKALFPVFCRPLGYVVLLVALFLLPILLMQGLITDHNLLFYKECTKLLMMAGCLLWRVLQGDVINVDTSSFLTFLIFNVLCLEFGLKKALVDRFFKR